MYVARLNVNCDQGTDLPYMTDEKDGEFIRYTDYALQWDKRLPTEPGAYWFRDRYKNKRLVEIARCPAGVLQIASTTHAYSTPLNAPMWLRPGNEWCGPLYNPD